MYEARKICNFLLAHYDAQAYELTNLRLNKLLYFVQGWSLTSRPNGVIRNHFEAWQHGPVVRPVYESFKVYGEEHIRCPAEHLDYATGIKKTISYTDISKPDAELIVRIFTSYSGHSTNQLVKMSHEVGGPWHAVYHAWAQDKRLSPRIPQELIRQYFFLQAGGKVRH